MFANTKATNGFAVDDLEAAKQFYGETLGLGVTVFSEEFGLGSIQLAGGRDTLVYVKPDFVPATYTILNFEVDDVDAAVDELASKGVSFERYEGSSRMRRASPAGPAPALPGSGTRRATSSRSCSSPPERSSAQALSSFAFWAANSSSVRIPCAFSSPSSLSWSIIDSPAAAGAGAAGAAGGGAC